jgi:aminoglycoside phosphotransferase (APT) family kinase protein
LPSLMGRLRALHWADCPDQPPFAGTWWLDEVNQSFVKAIVYLHSRHVLPLGEAISIRDLVQSTLPTLEPNPTSLLHGDLSPRNVILRLNDPTCVAGLIDWDECRFGDYMWDVANVASFYDETPGIAEMVLREYHGGEEHTGLARRFWCLYLVQSVIKLEGLHRIESHLDFTRGVARIRMATQKLIGVDKVAQGA